MERASFLSSMRPQRPGKKLGIPSAIACSEDPPLSGPAVHRIKSSYQKVVHSNPLLLKIPFMFITYVYVTLSLCRFNLGIPSCPDACQGGFDLNFILRVSTVLIIVNFNQLSPDPPLSLLFFSTTCRSVGSTVTGLTPAASSFYTETCARPSVGIDHTWTQKPPTSGVPPTTCSGQSDKSF